MFSIVLFILLIGTIMLKAQSGCDSEMCNNICNGFGMNGVCDGNYCDCSGGKDGKKCSELIDMTCNYLCEKLDLGLKGECDDNGYCVCKVKIEPCFPWECEKQCLEDPRAEECMAEGGIVYPVGCFDYGKIQTCFCVCELPGANIKNSSKFFEYSVQKIASQIPSVVSLN